MDHGTHVTRNNFEDADIGYPGLKFSKLVDFAHYDHMVANITNTDRYKKLASNLKEAAMESTRANQRVEAKISANS